MSNKTTFRVDTFLGTFGGVSTFEVFKYNEAADAFDFYKRVNVRGNNPSEKKVLSAATGLPCGAFKKAGLMSYETEARAFS